MKEIMEKDSEIKLAYSEFKEIMGKHSCGSCIHQEKRGCCDECIECYLSFLEDYYKRWGLKA